MKQFFSKRLNRISAALLLTAILSAFLVLITDTKNETLVTRGDFPGFYVLAEIKKLGMMDKIYDPALQRSLENKHWPSFAGSFYMSVYPAYTATLLFPLAFFAPSTALQIFSLFMTACLLLSVYIISKINRTVSNHLFPVFIFTLFFSPVFYATFGAQNTGLSMLLFSSIIYFLKRKTTKDDFFAGLAAGFWLFKPQYAVFMIALFLSARLWYALLGTALIAGFFQILAAWDKGFFWFIEWIKALQQFSDQNFISNAPQIVSISGTVRSFASNPTLNMLTSCFVVFLMVMFLLKVAKSKRDDLYGYFVIFGPLLVLISPQTLFYDLGIAYVSYLITMNFTKTINFARVGILNLISFIVVMIRENLPIPLFFLFALFFIAQARSGSFSPQEPELP